MNILFDISVLGIGHMHNRARTGIFRTVEQLAYGLSGDAECSVAFCSSQCNYMQCTEYLQANSRLNNSVFSVPDSLLGKIYNQIEPTKIKISRSSHQLLNIDLLRKIYKFGKKYVPTAAISDIVAADIYHSPINPIPKQILSINGMTQFLTIYDLIPLSMPQYFSSDETEMLKRLMAQIESGSFALCISESTRNDVCNNLGIQDTSRIFVTPLAADERFQPCNEVAIKDAVKSKYGIPRECEYILGVSTLEPRKNIDHTIRCFIELLQQERITDLVLVLSGAKGWDYDRIFAEIDHAVDFHDRIILTGYVPDDDLAPLYSGAVAFVYPSLYEGFGLPPLEAMQCGVPVITSNTSSLPEVVGDAGVLVSPTDSDALCQAIFDVYSNEAMRRNLSFRSLQRSKQFSWEKTHQLTIAAYKSALGR